MRFLSTAYLLLAITLIGLLSGCQGVRILNPEDIYSKEFLAKINGVNAIFKDGDKFGARSKLLAMNDNSLNADEKAKKYNLLGVIEFSQVNYEKAVEHFVTAKSNVRLDRTLMSQIRLNLASTYYKLSKYEFAFEEVKSTDVEFLPENEKPKYFQLKYVLAAQLGHPKEIVTSLVEIMGQEKTLTEVKNSKFKEALLDNYRKLADTERVYLLEKYRKPYPMVVAFLAEAEVEKRYYTGDKSGAKDVLKWLSSEYSQIPEVLAFIDNFQSRMDNFAKIKMSSVGVVLPFTEDHEKFSQKTLMGIETALSNPETNELNLQLHIEDNKYNPYIAREKVRELVQKHHISVIIGGLFPKTATDEYLEARKYGVMFISLSEIYVPREMKNHLLFELTGSIQSQLAVASKPEVMAKFGKKIGVFYPKSSRGESYVDEFWTLRDKDKISIVGIQGYDGELNDYREPVKKILGLKFPRERNEELQILKEVYKNEDKGSIRRVQTLAPILDFDWVFLPSIPPEAVQIISYFKYFDAMGVTFVGGPTWWTSKDLVNEQRKSFGKSIYFIGSDPKDINSKIYKDFKQRNNRSPGLLEVLGFEALALASNILEKTKPGSRDEFEGNIIKLQTVKGISGEFNLQDGVWIKELEIMKINRGNIEKVNLTFTPAANEQVGNES